MVKTADATRPPSFAAKQSSASFFDKKNSSAEAATSFFSQSSGVQTKLAMGKEDDVMEQEADQVADRVQTKLSVGASDDPYETEADQMADKVVNQVHGSPSVQAKMEPSQRGREMEEGDYVFLKPAAIQRLGEEVNVNGSRESIVAAARSMIGKIEARHDEGGQRVGAEFLLEIFHLAAPGVWPDSIITKAGATLPSWCGIFSVWAHKKAGKDIGNWQIGKGVSAFGTIQQTTSPQAGDIGYIDQPFQHHAVIVKVEGSNVHSIDGNSGLYSEVKENVRPMSAYSGFLTAFGAGSALQRKKIQRKGNGNAATVPASVEQSISSSKGKGESLPGKVQHSMGSAMGADFSDVRVHADQNAADMSKALDAQAFTHGKDIYFNRNKYNPSSKDGDHLLAHELTHTIQQGASAQRKMIQKNGNGNNTAPANPGPQLPDFDATAKEFHVEKVKLPAFKNRNKDKFAIPLHALSPRPEKWNHNEVWDKFVRKDVFNKTGSWLQDKKKTRHGDQDIYFLKAKNSDFRLFGDMVTIQEAAINPKWSRMGTPTVHQVDHIVEVQLGGDNTENNFELMDASANTNSGGAIMRERFRRMDEARDKLATTKYPNIPSRKTLNSNYITFFHTIDGWDLPHVASDRGNMFWKIDEIKSVKQLEQLRSMTDNEIKASQGEVGKEYVLYMRKDGGTPIKIKLPFKAKTDWLPGIDLTGFDDQQKNVTFKINKKLTRSLRQDREFTVPFTSLDFMTNAGYLNFNTTTDKGLEGFLQFNGLSPLVITEFSLHETKGFILTGNIITNIPIIDKTPIAFSLMGEDFTVSKELELGDIKDKFPKPFVVNDVSLTIFGSTEKGVGAEGTLDFELPKIGKGQLKGIAASKKGFGIEGSFEFDPALFKSKIKASYIDKEFKFEGSVTLEKDKIPGVQSLTISAKYEDEKISGKGKAKLNIPGVKEIGISVEQQKEGGVLIAGDIEFGNKLKSDAKVQAVFENGDAGWDVSIKGTLNPNINVGGLSITKVETSYSKGVFDVSAKVHFEKGKITGDFDLGVTNGNLDEDGKKLDGVGKELAFYASGEVSLDIVKGVDGKLQVKIKKDGDIIIGGKIEVTENKSIIPGKAADMNTDKALEIIPPFGQKIPIASCGVATVVLELKAGVGLFYDFTGLTLDKGTNVTLEPVSLNDLGKAKVNSDLKLSTEVKAGVDAFIEASAGLEFLIAGIKGKGRLNLKLTAIDAKASAEVEAGFSADKGLEFKSAEAEFDVKSKIGYDVKVGVEVYLNLLVTDLTLWEHNWEPADLKGEREFDWFDEPVKVGMKFGENNSLNPDEVSSGLKGKIGEHAKNQDTYKDKADEGINKNGPDPKAEAAKSEDRIKTAVGLAYRGAHVKEVFAFNSSMSMDYFNKRKEAWKIVENHKKLNPEIKARLKKEMLQYEQEELDAFKKWLYNDVSLTADSKHLVIDDFLRFRPSIDPGERMQLESIAKSAVTKDPALSGSSSSSSSAPATPATPPSNNPLVLKKDIQGSHGYAIPDDFAEKMEFAKAHGVPMPIEVSAEMGKEFGADFRNVRVHYDDEAIALTSEVNAQAFTHENHIFFNRGKYEPESFEGKKLLAHELTHVLQQGHGAPVKRVAELDPTGTRYTGNYIFNPGHDGLNSAFFSTVKSFVADGSLSDAEIRALRKDAINRNGSVLNAELLLMAAMRNPVNITLMQAHRGGSLILSMSNILDADKNYIINFDRGDLPPELASPITRLALAFLGLSGETVEQARTSMDQAAQERILKIGGTQFADQANRLVVAASYDAPVVPLQEVLTAMINAASDSTPGDQIAAGTTYLVARKYGHSTAPHILNGQVKVDALIPSVYSRIVKTGGATYSYSTDEDVLKANTLYLPTDANIFQVRTRALIIHELTHAEDDITRPAEALVDSLDLESRAYVAQGRYLMDETIAAAPAPGLITESSVFVNLGPLYYWAMLLAAKRNTTKYEAVFLNICTSAPASKLLASVKADLALGESVISANIRAALLAYRNPAGVPLYTAGKTRLGGGPGN